MRPLRLVAFALVAVVSASLAVRTFARPPTPEGKQDSGPGKAADAGPQGEGKPPGGGPGFHLLPRFVEEKLNLTDDQRDQYDALQKETEAKLEKILTADQIKILKETRPPRRGPGGGQGGGGQGGGGQDGPPPPPQN